MNEVEIPEENLQSLIDRAMLNCHHMPKAEIDHFIWKVELVGELSRMLKADLLAAIERNSD